MDACWICLEDIFSPGVTELEKRCKGAFWPSEDFGMCGGGGGVFFHVKAL